MSIWKKAVSVGTSAALLATLFTAVVAAPVSAVVTVGSAGNVPRAGTSTGTVSFTFTESTAACLVTPLPASPDLTVTINQAGVTFSGTPVVSAPGSLGATASASGGVLTINMTGSDPLNIETLSITGLNIAATSAAPLGTITATLAGDAAEIACFTGGTTTATGTIATGIAAGSTSVVINVDDCDFAVTDTTDLVPGALSFDTAAETRNITVVTAGPGTGQLTLTTQATANTHQLGETVRQTGVPACQTTTLSPLGTVVDSLVYNAPAVQTLVFPGEPNQLAANLSISERTAGFISVGRTITFTIDTAGVTFSNAPTGSASAGAAVSGTQTLTVAAAAAAHLVGAAVSQGHAACTSSGTLTAATIIGATSLSVTGVALTCPFTATAGTDLNVVVGTDSLAASAASAIAPIGGTALAFSGGALSADRKSITFTVTTASTGTPATFTLSNIRYDVASSVASGTAINVTAAVSGRTVVPTSRSNAIVGRVFTASVASSPTVFIGQNAQPTGLITLVEVNAGAFTAGSGPNNVFEVCLPAATPEFFTSPGPWARVTAGDLRLREGNVASPDNIVQGTPLSFEGDFCYYWTVWTASTAVSTIQIGNADFSSGPLVSVPAIDPVSGTPTVPGPVIAELRVGSLATINVGPPQVSLQIANRVFQNQVVVTALSQPTIPKGATDALAGNIQVAETANGQLKAGESICVEVLPRTSNNIFQDTYLKALATSDLPNATSSGGLVIGQVSFLSGGCRQLTGNQVATHTVAFSFPVVQQSTSGQGKVVISNIHYITTADAPNGPVLVNVFGFGSSGTTPEFQATISNAKIGVASLAEAWIAAGRNIRANSAFGLNTVSVRRATFITVRGRASGSAANDLVEVWVKTKTTAWHKESSRRVSTDGYVYYSGKVLNLGYRYYRFFFQGSSTSSGGNSNTVRAYGR